MTRRALAAVFALLAAGCLTAPLQVATPAQLSAAAARLPVAREGDAVVVAAGDIADCAHLDPARATAALVAQFPSATVLAAGDTAYPDGAPQDYARCYDPTWGAFKSRTRPATGNHEYHTPNAAGYFAYFGVAPFYSFDLGNWHLVSIDSMSDMSAQSAQVDWLRRDLDSTSKPCVLAFWHHPRFSSGFHGHQRGDPGRKTDVLWRVLAEHRAEVIVNGHDHDYERFAPVDGLRQFVAGTGGGELRPMLTIRSGSEFRDVRFGVLVLTLHPDSYEWAFLSTDGVVRDASSAPEPCH